jgi:hypothetical protein
MKVHRDEPSLPRRGLRRLIVPWEYRHLRGFAYVRFGGGALFLVFAGILLPYAAWWALLPVAGAVANFAWGYWYLTMARAASQGGNA